MKEKKPLRQYTGTASWFASWKDWNEPDKREFILTTVEKLERDANNYAYLARYVDLLEEHTRQQKALIEQLLRLIEIQRKEE